MTRVATADNEATLLEMALVSTGAQLERLCRSYRGVVDGEKEVRPEERSVQRRHLPGGMIRLELVLQSDEAELIMRALQRAREVDAERAEPPEAEAAAERESVPERPPAKIEAASAETPYLWLRRQHQ